MRKLTEPEAHRARAAIVDGRFPDGMTARCAWCRQIAPIDAGDFLIADIRGVGTSKLFRCGSCSTTPAT